MNAATLPLLVAFDLDDTLAPSKSRLEPEMAVLLARLLDHVEVCVISGGDFGQFRSQLIDALGGLDAALDRLHLMPTCGTQYFRFENGAWVRLYAEVLSPDESSRAEASLIARAADLGLDRDRTWGPRVEHRGSQVTYSALGQQAPHDVKRAWDPGGEKKAALRSVVADDLPDLEVRSGGSTSIDITRKGVDKAYGLRRLISMTGIPAAAMRFYGDRLDPGGNDHPVIATGIPCVAVASWEETKLVVAGLLEGASNAAGQAGGDSVTIV